jgi:acylphosphatase
MERTNQEAEARCFRIAGRVQGVGFRWWTRQTASALGVVGRVWNREDGGVEIWARGSSDALAAMADALSRGPAGARVDTLEATELPDEARGHEEGWTEFMIARV